MTGKPWKYVMNLEEKRKYREQYLFVILEISQYSDFLSLFEF